MFNVLFTNTYTIASPHDVEGTATRIDKYLNKGFFDADTYHLRGHFTTQDKFTLKLPRRIFPLAHCVITPQNGAAVVNVKFRSFGYALGFFGLFMLYGMVTIHPGLIIVFGLYLVFMAVAEYVARQAQLSGLEAVVNKP